VVIYRAERQHAVGLTSGRSLQTFLCRTGFQTVCLPFLDLIVRQKRPISRYPDLNCDVILGLKRPQAGGRPQGVRATV